MALPVYPGARQGVAKLRKLVDVFVVTSPFGGPFWTDEREQWLAKHFDFKPEDVGHVRAKHKCAGDFLVDDKTSTLVKWQKHFPTSYAVLWERPWNSKDKWDGLRVKNWEELEELLTEEFGNKSFATRHWTHFSK